MESPIHLADSFTEGPLLPKIFCSLCHLGERPGSSSKFCELPKPHKLHMLSEFLGPSFP